MSLIKKYNQFIKENNQDGVTLEYMAFDFDDNILFLKTKIHMLHLVDGNWVPEDVSTSKFAEVRNDKDSWKLTDDAFSEFRDSGPRGDKAYVEDIQEAISEKAFAPSWSKFLECLINGNIFSIITARGHASNTIRSGIEYIIYNALTESQRNDMIENLKKFHKLFGEEFSSKEDLISDYLDNCYYYGVSSPEFLKLAPGGAGNPEKGKQIAIELFTKKAHEYGQKIGAKKVQLSFSDDDLKNVDHIEKFMRNELSLKYIMQYNVFDTSKRGETARRIKITEEFINPSMDNRSHRVVLDSQDFSDLVSGKEVSKDGVKIILSDIGFDEMSSAIKSARHKY